MRGPIVGDIVGSAYEGAGKYPEATYATPDFSLFAEKSRFTDDTVLTVALADALLTEERDFAGKLRDYTKKYPERRYGKGFLKRVKGDLSDEFAGKSFTNGSAMRVIPVAWAAKDLEEALNLAAETAKISHDHPEGIKGAQAIASAVYLAKSGATKEAIRSYLQDTFAYPFSKEYKDIRETYDLGCTCQLSVPAALDCFFFGEHFEDTLRKAVLLGGDTDTIAAMSGGIAEAFYTGVPKDFVEKAISYLRQDSQGEDLIKVVEQFREKYGCPGLSDSVA